MLACLPVMVLEIPRVNEILRGFGALFIQGQDGQATSVLGCGECGRSPASNMAASLKRTQARVFDKSLTQG